MREQNAALANDLRDGKAGGERTDATARARAVAFRKEQRLPVAELPTESVEEQVSETPVHLVDSGDFSQDSVLSAPEVYKESQKPVADEPQQPPAPTRARPVPSSRDEDDDFSHERIMYGG